MTALKLKARVPLEDDEAQWLLQWARTQRYGCWKLSDLLIMIPNGAYLAGDRRHRCIQMAKMKRMGLRPGVFDYLLAIPVAPHHGLFLELKRRSLSVVSGEQEAFRLDMYGLGYATAIAKGWEAAKDAINHYLQGATA